MSLDSNFIPEIIQVIVGSVINQEQISYTFSGSALVQYYSGRWLQTCCLQDFVPEMHICVTLASLCSINCIELLEYIYIVTITRLSFAQVWKVNYSLRKKGWINQTTVVYTCLTSMQTTQGLK